MKTCQLFILACAASASAECAVFDFHLSGEQINTLISTPNIVGIAGIAGGSVIQNAQGIALDTGNQTLFLNFAWGDMNGLKDLKTAFTGASIQLIPSGTATPTAVYDLTPHVTQQTPSDGGVFAYTLHLGDIGSYTVTQQETDLLQAHWYVTVQTVGSPSGEIKSQLAPVPEPALYGTIAGFGLLGFAVLRSRKVAAV